MNVLVPPTPKLSTFAQDASYAIHIALSRLHRLTNAWQHKGEQRRDGENLVISLRETAKNLYAYADKIEDELRKDSGSPA